MADLVWVQKVQPSAQFAWRRFEADLPGRLQGLLVVGETAPRWASARIADQVRQATVYLSDSFRDVVALQGERLKLGQITEATWRSLVEQDVDRFLVMGHSLGAGTFEVGPSTAANLDHTRELLHTKLGSLQTRMASGEITQAQGSGWAAQAARGHERAAVQTGAIAEAVEQNDGIRWVMTAGEDHCTDCPVAAGLYVDLDDVIATVGGLPGEGATECHGNCKCDLEPQAFRSVYEDTSESLNKRRVA